MKAGSAPQKAHPQVQMIPFTHAAHENMEFVESVTKALSPSSGKFPQVEVPARGYLRHLWFRTFGSGGVDGGGATGNEDFPFNVWDSLSFLDVGGGEIFNPYSGHDVYCVNKFGGYAFMADPTLHPDYSADPLNFNFALRIPFEISASDALGALSNQNSKSKYKFKVVLAPDSDIYSVVPDTTNPTVEADIYTELWSQPPPETDQGVPILNRPPLLGTTQYWSKQIFNVDAGQQNIEIERRGNQDRTYICIFRDSNGLRSDAMVPDPVRMVWDSREQLEETPQYRRQLMQERFGTARTDLDRGVYVYDYSHDVLGHPGGMDDGHLWLRTKSSSRLEFRGNFGDSGTLTILHNDVAPVAIEDQYSDISGTGGAVAQTV